MTRTNTERRRDREGLRWKTLGAIRPEMAWPGGPRRVACLSCDRMLWSTDRGQRMCADCREGRDE